MNNELIKWPKFDYKMQMHDVDLDLIRCFTVVASSRSFTIAGRRLGRSQSAISVRIKKLEEALGCTLFLRNNSEVSLTDQGQNLLPKAKRLLSDSEQMLAEMKKSSISGRIRIGILEYVAPHRLAEMLNAIQRKLPDADLRFRVGLSHNLRVALNEGEIDLALALHDTASETSTPIAIDPLVWVEGPDALRSGPDDEIALCLMQAPCIYRQAALATLAKTDIRYREVLTANSVQSVRSAVLSGLGQSVLGASCLGDGLVLSRRLQRLNTLPPATLSLHGTDHRKADIALVLQQILSDHLNNGLGSDGNVFAGVLSN